MIIKYQALNSSGTIVADTISADDTRQAYSELSRRGLTPIHIEAGHRAGKPAVDGSLLSRVRQWGKTNSSNPHRASRKELPFFTAQMSILLETGTPVAASLEAIERQVSCPHWRCLISQLYQHVEEGGTLASAVALFPRVFDPLYGCMISAGEASGNLTAIFSRLAELSRQSDRIRKKVISALIYPTLLTTIAFGVVLVLVFFVLPRFATVFDEMNVSLPRSTQMMLTVSDLIRNQLLLVLILMGISVTSLVYWLRSEPGRKLIARSIIKIPIIGALIKAIINARICRLIGLLVDSSVPLLEALNLTKTSTKHYLFAEMIREVHDNVLHGQPMYEVLSRSPLVPPSIAQMVHTGEENAQVGKVMTMLADHLDDQNETKINMLTNIMEPFILIFMGIIIGGISISLVLPMFDLSQISGNG